MSKSKKNSEYYVTPEFDMAFSIYKRLIFIALNQKEAKLRYPIFLTKLKEYKINLENELRSLLMIAFMTEFGKDAKYAIEKVNEIINYDGFLEHLILSVQRGSFFDVSTWANVINLPLSSDLQKELFIHTKTRFEKYFWEDKFGTYGLECSTSEIVEKNPIVTILYELDVKEIFVNYLQFFLYANILIDNKNNKLEQKLDVEDIESIHNKIITPLNKYPSFIFQNLEKARISIEKNNEFDFLAGRKLNLSIELDSNFNDIPQILQNYLLEYFRLSNSEFNGGRDLDYNNGISSIVEFLENLINENSEVIRKDELLSLIIMLLFYDYSFDSYVNDEFIAESINEMKEFYFKNLYKKDDGDRDKLKKEYHSVNLQKNIHHARNNRKKFGIDDFFSHLEGILQEQKCLELSKKLENSIEFILDDGEFKKSKNITKAAFIKLKQRILTKSAPILQEAISS